ncbi:MAG: hypothetical protein S4CHLAM45_02320 [Chlamydiales bacterium]|nr:hypothetical protein [Chlamydiales bacterium]MCH9619091.1 hypothetical protein [Chlamydiales bacterium]MCH9622353.1 hypothetical protein [Chlamydiales bacterium]
MSIGCAAPREATTVSPSPTCFTDSSRTGPSFISETEMKCWRIFKAFVSCTLLIFYTFSHWLASLLLCPCAHNGEKLQTFTSWDVKNGHFAEKITIMADGSPVDVLVIHSSNERKPKKWTIVAGGNGEGIESYRRYYDQHNPNYDLVTKLGGSILFFDYRGLTSRTALVRATRAMMKYVEHLGGEQVACVGASLGGGLIREAYALHKPHKKEGVKYAFLFDRSFSTFADAVSALIHPIAGLVVRILGWNIGSGLQVEQGSIVVQAEQDQIIKKRAWLKKKEVVILKNENHMDPFDYRNICSKLTYN